MSLSPSQRTLKTLRELGYTVQVTEKWNPWARRRQDLFGFVDVLCLGDHEILGVQCTTMANKSAHLKKMLEHPNKDAWIRSGAKLQLWCWRPLRTPRLHWEVDITHIE